MSAKFKTDRVLACSPVTARGEHAFISGDPKGKNFLYVNGNNILIRDIENPSICDVFIEHQFPTTSAKYSPSGFYIASGDNRGNLKIWDTTNPEHIVAKAYTPLGGAIKDIAWTEDSKRLVLVGEGREKYGTAIAMDTGTTVGVIDNILKKANSCDIRPMRPYRAIVGSDDRKVYFFEGVPFKYKTKMDKHSNFVLCTRYAPDGSVFVSTGTDGMCFLYDGKTAEYKQTLGGEKSHKGGVYGASWSGDSRQLLTVSADKTAKIWDVETGQAVTEFAFGQELENQQLGCLWQNNHLLSIGLDGAITYLNPSDPGKPIRIVKGHQKAIKSLAVNKDRTKVYSASFDGVTNCWDVGTGAAETVGGKNKPKLLTQMYQFDDKICTVGHDDLLRTIDTNSQEYEEEACGLDSQPQAVAVGAGKLSIVAGIEKISVFRNNKKGSVLDVPFKATTVDIHPNNSEVAVGAEDGQLHIYTLSGDTLTEKNSFQAHTSEITKCNYSPDGEYLVAGSASKMVEIFKVQEDYKPLKHVDFKHYTKVTDIAWCPDNRHYASTALDGSVYIWDVDKADPVVTQKNVHGRIEVSSVQWLNNTTIVTAGADGCLRISVIEI